MELREFGVSADGSKVTRFAPKQKPDDPALIAAVEAALHMAARTISVTWERISEAASAGWMSSDRCPDSGQDDRGAKGSPAVTAVGGPLL